MGGRPLLRTYSNLYTTLQTLYPEHTWLPWKFSHSSKWLQLEETKKLCFQVLGKLLHVNSIEEWIQVNFQVENK